MDVSVQGKGKQQAEKGEKVKAGGLSVTFLSCDDSRSQNIKYPKENLKISFLLKAVFDSSLPTQFPDAEKTLLCRGRSICLTSPSVN